MAKVTKKLFRAQSAISLKKYELAIKFATEALHENPNNEYAYLTLAQAHAFLKNFDNAKKYAQIALSFSPNDVIILSVYCSILIIRKDYEECIKVSNKILQIEPRNKDALANKMFILFQKQQYLEAEKIAKFLIELNPNNSEYYNSLANIYNKTERQSLAQELYKKALQLDPLNPTTLNDYAIFLMSESISKYDDALELLKSSLQTDPNNKQRINNYEVCFIRKKLLDYLKGYKEWIITSKLFLQVSIILFIYSLVKYKNLDAFIFCLIFMLVGILLFGFYKKIENNKNLKQYLVILISFIVVMTTYFAYKSFFPFNIEPLKKIHFIVYDIYHMAFSIPNYHYKGQAYYCKSLNNKKIAKINEEINNHKSKIKQLEPEINKLQNLKYKISDYDYQKIQSLYDSAHILKDSYYVNRAKHEQNLINTKLEYNKNIDKRVEHLNQLMKITNILIDIETNKMLVKYCVKLL